MHKRYFEKFFNSTSIWLLVDTEGLTHKYVRCVLPGSSLRMASGDDRCVSARDDLLGSPLPRQHLQEQPHLTPASSPSCLLYIAVTNTKYFITVDTYLVK